MKPKRIYEVAKELNMNSADILKDLKLRGRRVDNIFNTVSNDEYERLKKEGIGIMLFEDIKIDGEHLIEKKIGNAEEKIGGNLELPTEKIKHRIEEYKKPKDRNFEKRSVKNRRYSGDIDINKLQSQYREVCNRLDSTIRTVRNIETDVGSILSKVERLEKMVKKLLPDVIVSDLDFDPGELRRKAAEEQYKRLNKNGNGR